MQTDKIDSPIAMKKTRQHGFAALGALMVCLVVVNDGAAQEPSAALKKADAAYRAGQAALTQRDLAGAQADFEQVVHLAPQAEQGHSALGAVLVARGQVKEGIRELERALAIKPSDATAQTNLAMAYEQIGLPEKAIPLFLKLRRMQDRRSARFLLMCWRPMRVRWQRRRRRVRR